MYICLCSDLLYKYYNLQRNSLHYTICRFSCLLVDPGKARGCSTSTVVTVVTVDERVFFLQMMACTKGVGDNKHDGNPCV